LALSCGASLMSTSSPVRGSTKANGRVYPDQSPRRATSIDRTWRLFVRTSTLRGAVRARPAMPVKFWLMSPLLTPDVGPLVAHSALGIRGSEKALFGTWKSNRMGSPGERLRRALAETRAIFHRKPAQVAEPPADRDLGDARPCICVEQVLPGFVEAEV